MNFIHHISVIRVFHAVMTSAIAAVSKYHIPDKDSSVNVGRHPLVTTTKKVSGNKNLHSQIIDVLYLVQILFGV